MAQQTLKRKVEDNISMNNDLNDSDSDFTYGGKRPRYIYNHILQSFDILSNSTDDTESVLSIQSKTTVEAADEEDLPSIKSCSDSDCNCENYNHSEYEVLTSSSSSSHKIQYSASSDSSTEVTNNLILKDESLHGSDNGYLPDDTDIQVPNISIKKLPPPACFKFCVQCLKSNPNPYYQYCFLCYRYRKEFFEKKPVPKPKNIKFYDKKESKTIKDSQDSGVSITDINTQENLTYLSPNEDIKINMLRGNDNDIEMCNICLINPKNGIFNHGKIGHIFSCYSCSKKIWSNTHKCPICNQKIKFLTKMVNA